MENLQELLHEDPIISFAILLAVILIVPIVFERFRLPGIIGLLFAGIALGPNGLKLLNSESQVMTLLSDIGVLYLMFVAGLEIDLNQFKKVKYRAGGFGSLTFAIPLISGIAIGRVFNFDWNAAVLLGSLLASHTLLSYPIVSRLGVVNNEAVTVTIAATIFTDVGALLVLAICVGVNQGEFTAASLAFLLGSLAIYTVVVLFGFDRGGREFFKRTGADEGNQFLFVLLAVFLASFGAELIGVEKIVGAFLVGLAVNDVLGRSNVKEKVLFVGNVLFIPVFFVDIGLIIDIPAFLSSLSSIWLSIAMTIALLGSKFLASFGAKLLYRYSWREMMTMWSLSIPQVAATLAAALVAQRAGIVSEDVLNGVIVMMLVTVILSPIIVSRYAVDLPLPTTSTTEDETALTHWKTDLFKEGPFSVVVPVSNPQTEKNLIEMAAMLARHENGQIVPLSIIIDNPYLDALDRQKAVHRGEELLAGAIAMSESLDVNVEPVLRIDDRVAQGITRACQEQKASLVVMGWGQRSGFRTRLFGNIIDSVFASVPCPVAVTRLLASPREIQRILVPIENFSGQVARKVYFSQILADAAEAELTLLRVTKRKTPDGQSKEIRDKMLSLLSDDVPKKNVETRIIPNDDIVRTVLEESKNFDLVVLHSLRRMTNAEGLALSNITNRLVGQLTCSAIVLGEPQFK